MRKSKKRYFIMESIFMIVVIIISIFLAKIAYYYSDANMSYLECLFPILFIGIVPRKIYTTFKYVR